MPTKKTNKPNEYVLIRHANRHVRKAPNKNAESLHVTEVGQKIVFLGKIQNGWYKVKIADRIGWLYKSAGDVKDGTKEILKLKVGNWHIRLEPNAKSKSLIQINKTAEVVSLGKEENGWTAAEVGGIQGWIYSKAIDK